MREKARVEVARGAAERPSGIQGARELEADC